MDNYYTILRDVMSNINLDSFNTRQIDCIKYGAFRGLTKELILQYAKPYRTAEQMEKCINIILMNEKS